MIEGLWHWLLIWGLEHPRTLTCAGKATTRTPFNNTWCMCHWIYISIILVGHHFNLWCNHTIVLIGGKRDLAKWGYVFQLLNHMSTRCPSWSYDLIYNILRAWPVSNQEHNTLIPHRHEHDNQWDLWQSLPCTFIWNVSRKAGCNQNHGNKYGWACITSQWSFYKRGHIVPAMRRTSSSSKTVSIPTSERRPWFIIVFSWYLYLLLYIKSNSFL
jgi:hypothetical protein